MSEFATPQLADQAGQQIVDEEITAQTIKGESDVEDGTTNLEQIGLPGTQANDNGRIVSTLHR